MLFFFLFPLAPELPPSLLPVDFAIDSCGFGDAIPHFTATKKKSNKPGYVSSKRKLTLLVVCVWWVQWAPWF